MVRTSGFHTDLKEVEKFQVKFLKAPFVMNIYVLNKLETILHFEMLINISGRYFNY